MGFGIADDGSRLMLGDTGRGHPFHQAMLIGGPDGKGKLLLHDGLQTPTGNA